MAAAVVPYIASAIAGFTVSKVVTNLTGSEELGLVAGIAAGGFVSSEASAAAQVGDAANAGAAANASAEVVAGNAAANAPSAELAAPAGIDAGVDAGVSTVVDGAAEAGGGAWYDGVENFATKHPILSKTLSNGLEGVGNQMMLNDRLDHDSEMQQQRLNQEQRQWNATHGIMGKPAPILRYNPSQPVQPGTATRRPGLLELYSKKPGGQ